MLAAQSTTVQARDLHDLLVPFRILSQYVGHLKHGPRAEIERIEGRLESAYEHALSVLAQNLANSGYAPASCRWSAVFEHCRALMFSTYPKLSLQVKSTIDPQIAVPESVLRRVLVNLLDNSGRALNEQGNCCIEIYEDNPGRLSVKISNGFDPSGQAEAGGFGLGLGLVSDLLARYCGTLRVQHAEQRFSVELSLPIHKDHGVR